MMIWKISQDVNNGYDTYSDAVVVAADPEAARRTHPDGLTRWDEEGKTWLYQYRSSGGTVEWEPGTTYEWTNDLSSVAVELIGVATGDAKPGVVCASYHAG